VASQAGAYPADSYMMNMTSNHDLNSWEGTEFERLGDFAPAFAAISYVLPGMPLIYTGQEAGLDRALEFFKKDIAPQWEPRNRYFEFYRNLNALKHRRPELAAGEKGGRFVALKTSSPNVVAFKRVLGRKATLIAANLGTEPARPFACDKCAASAVEGAVDAFSGEKPAEVNPELKPGEYILYTIDSNE